MRRMFWDYDNVGGISMMYAIPVSDFNRVVFQYSTGKKQVSVSTTDNVVVLPCVAGKTSYSEVESIEEAGKLYTIELGGFVPRIDTDAAVRRILERGRWIVVHRDGNGVWLMSGTKDVPLMFMSSRTSGSGASGANGNSFRFSGAQSTPSIEVEEDFLVE